MTRLFYVLIISVANILRFSNHKSLYFEGAFILDVLNGVSKRK